MASNLGVARASVVSAYEHLLAEGYVESRQGSGTFISSNLSGFASRPRDATRPIRRAVPTSTETFPEFEQSAVQSDARPFNTGRALVDARTAETWRSLTHRVVRRLAPNDLGYTDPAGLAELRANICGCVVSFRASQYWLSILSVFPLEACIRVATGAAQAVHLQKGRLSNKPRSVAPFGVGDYRTNADFKDSIVFRVVYRSPTAAAACLISRTARSSPRIFFTPWAGRNVLPSCSNSPSSTK
jgi:Bacterial regulatory proteins, gntR family